MSRTIEVDLQPHHRRHREATLTVPLAPAGDSLGANNVAIPVSSPGLQATVETVPSTPTPSVRTIKTRPSRPATLVLPAEHHPINLNVNVNVPPPVSSLIRAPTTPLPVGERTLAQNTMNAAQMHIAEYESVHGASPAHDDARSVAPTVRSVAPTVRSAAPTTSQQVSVPAIQIDGLDMAAVNIPRLRPATPGTHHGKHRRSLHATVTIPMPTAAAPHPTTPPKPPAARTPPKLESPAHISEKNGNDVQVDVEPNHVSVHAHTGPSSTHNHHSHKPSHSRRTSIAGTHSGPQQTIIEVYPPSRHSSPPHQQVLPVTTAPTNVSLAPTRSVRTTPPRVIASPRHHTHRFPHSASTTSESVPIAHIHELVHYPGETVQVSLEPDERVFTEKATTWRVPIPQRFSDIQPIPIIDYHSFLKSPPPPMGQHIHPLHEIPNPAPAPTVPDELEMPHQLGSAQQDPTLDPDYYHRNSKAIPSTRTEMPSRSVAHPRTVTHGHGDNSENDSHPNRRKHGKHRNHHRRSHSHDRTSDHQSVITAYRKIEPVSGPADRVGEYALPPDYNTRREKEKSRAEKEAEAREARMKAQFPGMFPGPMGMNIGPPLGLLPGIRPPLMMPGMMGLGMRPPMMGMPIAPGMMPGMMIPGTMGGFNPNALPGRFGRDILGRDFAGPGGLGHSRPYRPPDPSVLRPMPQGLPFVARPPKEGFDAYGRPIPPPAPEGFDGWGRPIPGPNGQFPMMQPPGMPFHGMPPRREMANEGHGGSRSPSPATSPSNSLYGRPEEPPMFHRAPSTSNDYRYGDFEPFAFPASRLHHPGRLRRPHELKDHDIRQDEWGVFIEALSQEALRHVDHHSSESVPRLTQSVHELLRAWQIAYFGPRAVQVYVAKDGKKVYDHGFGVPRHRAALSIRDGRSMLTDTTSHRDVYSDSATDSSDVDPHAEARFSARERAYRREKRRQRAKERRAVRNGGREHRGEWEVHFAYTEPTMFKAGLKPRRYGEKVPFERPKY